LVTRLLHDGMDVRVLDNLSTGHRRNIEHVADDVDLRVADLRDEAAVAAAVRGCDVVFHEAALGSVPRSVEDPLTTHEVNATGTLQLLRAAHDAGVGRLVAASSSSVYGAGGGLPKHEHMQTVPLSPYGVSKLAAEAYCRSFTNVYGFETVALRYFNVFGPRQDPTSQYAAVIPMLEGRPPHVHGDGEQTRDFTYVDNVVEANLAAMRAPGAGGRTYNIACGGRISLNRLVTELRVITGAAGATVYGPPRAGDIRDSSADVSRARAELGYAPEVDFEEGLRRTVAALDPSSVPALVAA
jgi:nucleoside-diphosphate-sugar epimerase